VRKRRVRFGEELLDGSEHGAGIAQEEVAFGTWKFYEARVGDAARRLPAGLDVEHAVVASM
jgi:hypothetical protein